MIQGLLLAAGRSQRFGSDKRHALLGGEPLLLRTARRWLDARDPVLGDVLVVLREPDAAERELAQRLQQLGASTTFCAEARLGMGHSLAWGVLQTPRAEGWLIGLGDMPALRPHSIRAVAHALRPDGIVLPTLDGLRGHPVGFGAAYAGELLALRGDNGARTVLQAHRDALQWLELEDPGLLLDVDEPAQLSRAADAQGEPATPRS